MPNCPSFREVLRRLHEHDPRFQRFKAGGKGGHQMLCHPDIAGQKRSCPIPFHGSNKEVSPVVLKSIVRRFDLPKDFFKDGGR